MCHFNRISRAASSILLRTSFLIAFLCGPLAAGAANLVGLSIAPQNPTVDVGLPLQLTATGSYDNGTQLVIKHAKQVSSGASHTCALSTDDGMVQCWGYNTSGQLGNGTLTNSTTPIAVSGISTAVSVSAGVSHTCAVLNNGTVQCWGNNASGKLGNGTIANSTTPIAVSGISTAVSVSAGNSHTCAALNNGTVQCWGLNQYGQLGNGTTTDSSTPVTVSGISTAVSVSAGVSHTCAVLSGGTVMCWGYNYDGQLGHGTTITLPPYGISTPVAVSGISTGVAVSAANAHTCAALSDGTVKCWGDNSYGKLGNGTTTNSSVPVTASGISSAVAVSTGFFYTCAALSDGSAKCWGASLATARRPTHRPLSPSAASVMRSLSVQMHGAFTPAR